MTPRFGGLSLQARLLAGVLVVALVLTGVAVVTITTTRTHLLAQIDNRLEQAAEVPKAFAAQPGGGPSLPPLPPADGDGDGDRGRFRFSDVYQGYFSSETGTLQTVVEPNLGDYGAPAFDANDLAALGRDDGSTLRLTVDSTTGTTHYRLLVRRLDTRVAVTGLPLYDTDLTLSRLILVEAFGLLAVLAVLGAVAFWVIRLGIRPIKQITATASEISAANVDDLAHRVPQGSTQTEVGRLSFALNGMLDRIESAVTERAASEDRLRRFVGDASHELRTPVTTIRGYAELYRHGGLVEPANLDDAMRRTEQEAIRMGRLVEDMLTLAKLDQHRLLEHQPVDIGALVSDAGRDAAVTAPGRAIAATVAPGADLVIVGDADRLRQVLANIVANALVHTPSSSAVALEASRHGDQVVVVVRDQGPGMTPDVAARVTERFYRADPARARNNGGSGLGMAIVDSIVTAHGGTVDIVSSPSAGTAVTVTLPAAPAPVISPVDAAVAVSANSQAGPRVL